MLHSATWLVHLWGLVCAMWQPFIVTACNMVVWGAPGTHRLALEARPPRWGIMTAKRRQPKPLIGQQLTKVDATQRPTLLSRNTTMRWSSSHVRWGGMNDSSSLCVGPAGSKRSGRDEKHVDWVVDDDAVGFGGGLCGCAVAVASSCTVDLSHVLAHTSLTVTHSLSQPCRRQSL